MHPSPTPSTSIESSYENGTIFKVKPLEYSNGVLTVELPNKQRVSVPSAHLTDHPSHSESLATLLSSKKTLREAIVISQNQLSLKPSLLTAGKLDTPPSRLEDFAVDSIYSGTLFYK
jgi:hypothetical protein